MRRRWIVFFVWVLLVLPVVNVGASGEFEPIFSVEDPRGDSFGPGDYSYPQHQSFPQELPQMLDLTAFNVFNLGDEAVRFEFHFAQRPDLHQPWGGAGFNFHRLDLYIVKDGEGRTTTFRPGAQVEFSQPWQLNLRLRDWRGAFLIDAQHDPDDSQAGIWQDQVQGFDVFVEGNAIVVEISQTLIGAAAPQWKYYVLVGLQDPYGPDQYREINQLPGPWTGGGGCDSEFNPNLYDILVKSEGAQKDQLAWDVGHYAVLDPVGPESTSARVWGIIKIIGVVLMAAGLASLVWILLRKN